MLTHLKSRTPNFFTVKRGRLNEPGETERRPGQANFRLEGFDSKTDVSTSFDLPQPDIGEMYLNRYIRVKDEDSEPNLQLSVRNDEGQAKLLIENPDQGEGASLEFSMGEAKRLNPAVFQEGFLAEQAGGPIEVVNYTFWEFRGEKGFSEHIHLNGEKIDLRPPPDRSFLNELRSLSPEKLAELQDLWKS